MYPQLCVHSIAKTKECFPDLETTKRKEPTNGLTQRKDLDISLIMTVMMKYLCTKLRSTLKDSDHWQKEKRFNFRLKYMYDRGKKAHNVTGPDCAFLLGAPIPD
eukprot:457562_1